MKTILFLFSIIGSLWADSSTVVSDTLIVPADTSPVDTIQHEVTVEPLTIEGMVLDSATGDAPLVPVTIWIGDTSVEVDSSGEFILERRDTSELAVVVTAEGYGRFSDQLSFERDNRFYFLTIQLSKAKKVQPEIIRETTEGLPWTITGTIINSRFDIAISDTSMKLFFDDSLVSTYKDARYKIVTPVSGEHTLKLTVDGYHTVYDKIVLSENQKDFYHVVGTTEEAYENIRREMTVTADAGPLHEVAGAAKITLTRKDIQQTAATMTDPMRALHTLPGIASESDASARPIVRGGEVLESRVFIDGLPLIQPYHFGGARSIFNQSGVENLSVYKSGFPSKYHNAQSAVVAVDMRDPIQDKPVVLGDLNMMQYNTYVGIPLVKDKFGFYVTAQGSYFNALFKLGWRAISALDDEMDNYFAQQAKYLKMPDYQDWGAGFSWHIKDNLKLSVHESLNTDRFKWIQVDSVQNVTYYYDSIYYFEDTTLNQTFYFHEMPTDPYFAGRVRDTSMAVEGSVYYYSSEYRDSYLATYEDSLYYYESDLRWEQPIEFYDTDTTDLYYYRDAEYDSVSFDELALDYDTVLDYKSRYNILHANLEWTKDEENQIDFKAAWQKRWWDLTFPDALSDLIPNSTYDVFIDQWNLMADWTNSRFENHTINSGIQLDLTSARFDVYTPRAIHEMITKGNTNFADFWGPVTQDEEFDFGNGDLYDAYYSSNSMMDRLLVSYKGDRLMLNGSLYGEDEWRISDTWKLVAGARLEVSSADTSVMVSPRISSYHSLNDRMELTASAGLYTQNNYDVAVLALSEVLKPEKVWHLDVGHEFRILPWLTQRVNIFGKYYYDLASEEIDEQFPLDPEDIIDLLLLYFGEHFNGENIEDYDLNDIYQMYMMDMGSRLYRSHYSNSGRGYAYGLEYMLQYNPKEYWNGWVSVTLQEAQRQRHPGWRWHTFPLHRPFMFSWVNFYRLPRKYELGLKYRYMTGLPYTEVDFSDGMYIGAYNEKHYQPYNRFDIRISRGFRVRNTKLHAYLEIWNAFNAPNLFRLDSETKKEITVGFDLPVTAIFLGLDWDF